MGMPKQLGRYVIERELGKGAMGRVFLAHDPAIDRKIAVKTIHVPEGTTAADRSQVLARFQREVKAAGRLAHPHIITIHDAGQDPVHGMFIAMEYVEGRALEEYTRSESLLPPRTVATVCCQAADALSYAHSQGIVHRDIKPANLILVGERTVKIADFGLAKPEGASMTHDGTLLGTPYYMSPEQIQGGHVDGRSDLFSLGVVVYELLTGRRPFRGDSISTVIYRVLQEPPVEPDLGRLPAALPIKQFLARALAKKPEARFQSGDEFARALREAFASTPGAGDAPAPEKPPPAVVTATERPASTPVPGPAAGQPAPEGRPRPPGAGDTGSGAARRAPGPASSGRRLPRRRKARSLSLTPLLVLLVAAAGAAFVYRDALFDLVSPYLGLQESASPGPAAPSPEPPAGSAPTAPGAGDAGAASADEGEQKQPGPQAGGGGPSAPVQPDQPRSAPASGEGAGPSPPQVDTLISLRSEPPGATFELEGKTLPAPRVPLPAPGQGQVIQARLGCQEGSREITAADAGTEVVVSLAPASLDVNLTSEPSGATLQVDGRAGGRTPVRVSLDACKPHTLELRREGFKVWRQELELADGRLQAPAALEAKLVPLPRGTLLTPTPPYPVELELEGGRKLKPGEKVELVAATYRLTASSPRLLLRRQVRVTVPADRTVAPEIDFPPVGKLTVRAQPSNARIQVASEGGSRDLGAPPLFGEELVTGTYTVKCTFAHTGEVMEKVVTLAEGDNPAVVFVAGRP